MIKSKDYKIKLFGYNKDQVEFDIISYENQIATLQQNLEDAIKNNEELKKSNMVLSKEVQMITRDLHVKDNAMREMSKIAISEANHLVNSASKNADIIISEALSTARLILLELSYTTKLNNDLKNNLKSQIDDIISKIDKFETVELPDLRWLANYEKSND